VTLLELEAAIEALTIRPCEEDLDEGYRLVELLSHRLDAVADEIDQPTPPRTAVEEAAFQGALQLIDDQFRHRTANPLAGS
jgi:hypothetical protein